jgi:hypothetical protein
MLGYNLFEFGCDFVERLCPGDPLETISNALEGKFQSFRIILEIGNIGTLPADIPLRTGIFLIRPDLEDFAAFGDYFQAAILVTKGTRGFLPFIHGPTPFLLGLYYNERYK